MLENKAKPRLGEGPPPCDPPQLPLSICSTCKGGVGCVGCMGRVECRLACNGFTFLPTLHPPLTSKLELLL